MGIIPGSQVYPKDPRRQPDPQSIDLSQLSSGLFPNQVSTQPGINLIGVFLVIITEIKAP